MSVRVSKMGKHFWVFVYPPRWWEALTLKEGDRIEITIAGEREFKVGRDSTRENALKRLRNSKWAFPPGFKFDRAEANEHGRAPE